MNKEPQVWIFTRAYNAEKTIRRAIESILNQSFKDFKYLIRDNGSTDNTYQICKEYADQDSRIVLVHNDKNNLFESAEDIDAKNYEEKIWYNSDENQSNYMCILDADDEYLPDFLMKSVTVANESNSDIVICGTEVVAERTNKTIEFFKHEQFCLTSADDFSLNFPVYHWHLRQVWGKLYRRSVFFNYINYIKSVWEKYNKKIFYGTDTLMTMYTFLHAKSVYVLDGVDHKWYIQEHSASKVFDINRMDSDWLVNNETENYLLKKCGYISETNKMFLACVYENAVLDTMNSICRSNVSDENRFKYIFSILQRKETKNTLSYIKKVWNQIDDNCGDENGSVIKETTKDFENRMFGELFKLGEDRIKEEYDVKKLLNEYFPYCNVVFDQDSLKLFADSSEFRSMLLNNDNLGIILSISLLINQKKYTKKYNLELILKTLVADDMILSHITESKFIRKFYDIYIHIAKKEYAECLECITELFQKRKNDIDENLIWLYLTLSALLSRTDEFLYGKLISAEFYLKNSRYDESRSAITDLEEMGAEENDEIIRIKKELEKAGK